MRRQEAAEIAAAEIARAGIPRTDLFKSEPALEIAAQPAIAAETAPAEPIVAEPQPQTAEVEAPKARASGKSKRKPKTIEEQRAAAMKAAAKRVASFREQHMGRIHDIEQARWDQALTPQQIARASDTLIERGEKPTIRRVAEILGVSQLRVEKSWPKGVPLDGTGEIRAA